MEHETFLALVDAHLALVLGNESSQHVHHLTLGRHHLPAHKPFWPGRSASSDAALGRVGVRVKQDQLPSLHGQLVHRLGFAIHDRSRTQRHNNAAEVKRGGGSPGQQILQVNVLRNMYSTIRVTLQL